MDAEAGAWSAIEDRDGDWDDDWDDESTEE